MKHRIIYIVVIVLVIVGVTLPFAYHKMELKVSERSIISGRYESKIQNITIWAFGDSSAYGKAVAEFAKTKAAALLVYKMFRDRGEKICPSIPLSFSVYNIFGSKVDSTLSDDELESIDKKYKSVIRDDSELLQYWDAMYLLKM